MTDDTLDDTPTVDEVDPASLFRLPRISLDELRAVAREIPIEQLPDLVRRLGTAQDYQGFGRHAEGRPIVALLLHMHGPDSITVYSDAILVEWREGPAHPDQRR